MKAFCTSEASCATNWKAAPPTNTAAKIIPPLHTISGIISTLAGVQAMSSVVRAYPRTNSPWVIRPRRRSANLSAATWASTGTGRTRRVSRVPSRTRRPSRSMEPIIRSARPNAIPEVPYRRAISGRVKPPNSSTWENISRIATKSKEVAAKFPKVVMAKEAR